MRRLDLLLWPAALALGLAAEAAAFNWDDPRRWVPDLVVGLVFIGSGLSVWTRAPGVAALLGATGVAWFAGNFAAELLYLHRGPLVHLLLAFPAIRARTRPDLVAIAAGYAAALVYPVWRSDLASVVLTCGLIGVAAAGFATASGRVRRERLTALWATAALAAVLAGGAVARLAVPSGDAVEPALLAYEAVLCGIAVYLAVRARGPAPETVRDLVVELGESPAGSLGEALARTLADPTLEIGYWSQPAGGYLDAAGNAVALPEPGGSRAATFVERERGPYAVIVHDVAVLADPALVEALASATRLSASNLALRAEVRAQLEALTASRRRLLVAADDERRRLEERLRQGPDRQLAALGETLAAVPGGEHVEQARAQLSRTLDDLHQLARGLHPRELEEVGLTGALASLVERAPFPVALDVRAGDVSDEVAVTVYFVCAEALANVAKYAVASSVSLVVDQRDGLVSVAVTDDGVGGADPAHGTGLRGLADRVEALGGSLHVISPPGAGTRLSAQLPLGARMR